MKIHIITGFMDAGKTAYICDLLKNDYSYKRADGSALLLVCEEGEEEYDPDLLALHRVTLLKTQPDIENVRRLLKTYASAEPEEIPSRVFIEWNLLSGCDLEEFCRALHPETVTAIIDGTTLEVYFNNMRQLFGQMIRPSTLVIFNRTARESLADYAHAFRLMNDRCGYLLEGPGGYHEKAFDDILPYDKSVLHYHLSDPDYSFFWLDARKHPADYIGKHVTAVLEVARAGEDGKDFFSAGRKVMTCCMADISFMSFPCCTAGEPLPDNLSFVSIDAEICDSRIYREAADVWYSPVVLRVCAMRLAAPPENLIIQ